LAAIAITALAGWCRLMNRTGVDIGVIISNRKL